MGTQDGEPLPPSDAPSISLFSTFVKPSIREAERKIKMLYSEMATHTAQYTQIKATEMLDTYIEIYNNNELFADEPEVYKALNQKFKRRVIEELAEALGIKVELEMITTKTERNTIKTHTRYIVK